MKHSLSHGDREFLQCFSSRGIPSAQFHHCDCLRLAYIFLIEFLLIEFQSGSGSADARTAFAAAWRARAAFVEPDIQPIPRHSH